MEKRWGRIGGHPRFADFHLNSKHGDVTFDQPYFKSHFSDYNQQKEDLSRFQQFSFASNRPEQIYAGSVHVSVGFVDLGSLIWSDIIAGEPSKAFLPT